MVPAPHRARSGSGLPVLEGALNVWTGSVQIRPSASEVLLSVALGSCTEGTLFLIH